MPFPLLSDADGAVCRLYGVIKEKTMYGKKVLGLERSTFIIDESGLIAHSLRGVKVTGHARTVLEALES